MYTQFFGLKKKPFTLVPDPEFLYFSQKHRKALTMLQYGLMSQAGITVITGEIGSGKTTLVRYILGTLAANNRVGLITNTHSSFGDLLTWILSAFDIKHTSQDKTERYQTFIEFVEKQHQQNRRVILVVDEAQNMDIQTLEELRLLSNINTSQDIMLQLVMLGQPQLINKLNRPELTQLAQRITVEYHLNYLNYEESVQYIQHRITVAGGNPALFTKAACAAVYYYTGGIPRLINSICDLALVFAFAEEKSEIDAGLVVSVIKEKRTSVVVPLDNKRRIDSGEESVLEKIREFILQKTGVDLAHLEET